MYHFSTFTRYPLSAGIFCGSKNLVSETISVGLMINRKSQNDWHLSFLRSTWTALNICELILRRLSRPLGSTSRPTRPVEVLYVDNVRLAILGTALMNDINEEVIVGALINLIVGIIDLTKKKFPRSSSRRLSLSLLLSSYGGMGRRVWCRVYTMKEA